MNMESYEEYKEVRQKIKALLAEKEEWLSEHWLEAHEDLVRDQFAEELSSQPDDAVNRLISELDDAHRKLFHYLSGKEIVNLLRSKITDEQIVDVLIDAGETYERKPTSYLSIACFARSDFEADVFIDDHKDLADLVDLLPDDSIFKKDMFTVNIDIGPFYFCVKADTFLKEVEHLINDALAEGYIKELLETGSDA